MLLLFNRTYKMSINKSLKIISLLASFLFLTYAQLLAVQTDTITSRNLLLEINKKIIDKDFEGINKILNPFIKENSIINSYSLAKLHLEHGKNLKHLGDYQASNQILTALENKLDETQTFSKHIYPDLYHELGGIHLLLRDVNNASSYSLKSIEYRKKSKGIKAPALFKTYTNLGTIYQAIGQIESAIESFNKALHIKLSNQAKPDMQLAMIYQNIGRLFYQQEMFDSALYYYIESQNINDEILTDKDYQLGVFYANFGVLHKNIGNYEEALISYQRAEKIFINIFGQNDLQLYSIYSNIGNIYRILGDLSHALQYYKNSLALADKDPASKYAKQYSIYINMAGVYISYGLYEDAIAYLEKCFQIKEEFWENIDIELPYGNMAICYTKLGEIEKAEKFYQKQIEQVEESEVENIELANANLSYGIFCLSVKKDGEALQRLTNANKIYKKLYGNKHPYVAKSTISLADYYFNKDLNKCLSLLQNAFTQVIPDFDDKRIESNPGINHSSSSLILLSIFQKKAEALFALADGNNSKKLLLSLSTLDLATQLSQIIQVDYSSEESKLFISSNQKKYSVLSAQIAIQLHHITKDQQYLIKAFNIAEKSKAAILLSSLQDFDAKSISNIPAEISDQEKDINKQLSTYRELIYKEDQAEFPDKSMIDRWQKKVFDLTQQQEKIIITYKEKYPSYFNLKYETSVIALEHVQSQLNTDEALIEYVIGDTVIIALLITKNGIQGQIIYVGDEFVNHVNIIRNNLISGEFGNNAYENYVAYVQSSSIIYETILDNFLKNNNFKKLTIIPDHVLFYIPFEVLLSSKPKKLNLDYRKLDYLIKRFNIRYSYSATLSYTDFKKNRKTSRKLLAMAPEYGNYEHLNADRSESIKDYKKYLVNLPGVVDEIRQIVKSMRGKAYSGTEATEGVFKDIASDYGVLHLAMHTIVNNDNPMFSKLVFYLNNDSLEDGMLNTYELYDMNLNAKLAVLSACNTGSGALQAGEGVMSLARGFISAGCPSIIMTLWALEDKSGLEIMTSFYKLFARSKSSDYALWQAKLTYLQNADKLKAHPYFWSAYVMIGSPVKLKSLLPYYFGGFLLLLVVGFIAIKAKKKAS